MLPVSCETREREKRERGGADNREQPREGTRARAVNVIVVLPVFSCSSTDFGILHTVRLNVRHIYQVTEMKTIRVGPP